MNHMVPRPMDMVVATVFMNLDSPKSVTLTRKSKGLASRNDLSSFREGFR